MSSDEEKLVAAARRVDVIETAGRIIANPRHRAVKTSSAEILALAWAVETLNTIALESHLLVRALERQADDRANRDLVEAQKSIVAHLINRLIENNKETS